MQKIISSLIILVLCLAITPVAFGSPLVFKATKQLAENGVTELGSFDTSKFRQIRIAVISNDWIEPKGAVTAKYNLEDAQKAYLSVFGKYNAESEAVRSAKRRLDEAQKDYDYAVLSEKVGIFAVEIEGEIWLNAFIVNRSVLIDSPPSKISIKGAGKGTYKIFIWAS